MKAETARTSKASAAGHALREAYRAVLRLFALPSPTTELRQFHILAGQTRIDAFVAIAFACGIALVTCGIFETIAAPRLSGVLVWMLLVGCWSVVAFGVGQGYLRDREPSKRIGLWRLTFIAAYVFNGLVWAASLFLLWNPDNLGNQAFLIIVMIATLTVYVVEVSQHRLVFNAAYILFMSMVILRLATGASEFTTALLVLAPLFAAWAWFVGSESNRRVCESLDRAAEVIQMARRLEAAKAQAEVASHAKSSFLATMSHELRTPLNAIIGFSEIMTEEMFGPHSSPKYRGYAEDIHQSGRHLLRLVNDVLDMSKIETGKMELHDEDLQLQELVADCIRLFVHRASQKGIQLSYLPGGVEIVIRADEVRIKQALLNLVSNAIKFTPKGGTVTVALSANRDGADILVTDTGIGIAKADIERVFLAFQQVDSHLTRNHEGTGLGLPISRALIELHGGSLTIESQINVGTRARIRLPAERVVTALAVEEAQIA